MPQLHEGDMNQIKIRKLKDLREVLMNPEAEGPEGVYVMVRGNPNITVLVPGENWSGVYQDSRALSQG